jgi:hypothetical protein
MERGQLFALTAGVEVPYDGYRILSLCRALVRFDEDELIDQYLMEFPGQAGALNFDEEAFMEWLRSEARVIEVIGDAEWNLNDSYETRR